METRMFLRTCAPLLFPPSGLAYRLVDDSAELPACGRRGTRCGRPASTECLCRRGRCSCRGGL